MGLSCATSIKGHIISVTYELSDKIAIMDGYDIIKIDTICRGRIMVGKKVYYKSEEQ